VVVSVTSMAALCEVLSKWAQPIAGRRARRRHDLCRCSRRRTATFHQVTPTPSCTV